MGDILNDLWSSFTDSVNGSSDGSGDTGVFSYLILGIVALLLIAIVFGELEVSG
jgi:hypothetical protein